MEWNGMGSMQVDLVYFGDIRLCVLCWIGVGRD